MFRKIIVEWQPGYLLKSLPYLNSLNIFSLRSENWKLQTETDLGPSHLRGYHLTNELYHLAPVMVFSSPSLFDLLNNTPSLILAQLAPAAPWKPLSDWSRVITWPEHWLLIGPIRPGLPRAQTIKRRRILNTLPCPHYLFRSSDGSKFKWIENSIHYLWRWHQSHQSSSVTEDEPQIGFPLSLVISLTFLIGTSEKSFNF